MITSYRQLPFATYLALQELNAQEGLSDSEKDFGIIALLSGKSEDELWATPVTDYLAMKEQAQFLFTQPKPAKLRSTYTIGGKAYTYPKDFRELTTGQFNDFDTIGRSEMPRKELSLLAVLLYPEGGHFAEGYDALSLAEQIGNDINTEDALALYAFFLKSWNAFALDSLPSLAGMEKGKKKALRKALRLLRISANGGGSLGWKKSQLLPTAIGIRCWRHQQQNSLT